MLRSGSRHNPGRDPQEVCFFYYALSKEEVKYGIISILPTAARGLLWEDSVMRYVTIFLALSTTLIFLSARCDMNGLPQDQEAPRIRKAVFAGSWYPGDGASLKSQIEGLLDRTKTSATREPIRALISPHAGYAYSGATAAVGFKALRGQQINRVMVLAISHRFRLKGATIVDVTHYSTPMGLIPLDREACDTVLKGDHFACVPDAHEHEHSLEIQLPFLQYVLPEGFELIPILIGEVKDSWYGAMAATLLPFWDETTLVVTSSDFTHYGRAYGYLPFSADIPAKLAELDGGAIDFIEKTDPKGFRRYVRETGATICGRNAITLLLTMAKKRGYRAEQLDYTTSGALTGDYAMSVSYASIAITEPRSAEVPDEAGKTATIEDGLSPEERTTLLRLARTTLRRFVATGHKPSDLSDFEITPKLKRNLGAFVTLKIDGRLRGCIGYLNGRGPLYKSIVQNTINAASHDPRFQAVSADEEQQIEIEISVLGPVVQVQDLSEIEVGRDGLIVSRGRSRGTLLPQVAEEYGWTRTEFLEHTCVKAGLSKDAYKDSATTIERYSAERFREND